MIEIHPSATLSRLADIEDSVLGTKIIIGPRCVIDAFVKFKCAGGVGDVIIGENSHINSGTVLYTGNGIKIGKNVLIAANCTIAPTNHQYEGAHPPINRQRFRPSKGGILIEDDVWIASNCVVLDGAIIRQGAVIGALSLVRGEVEAYSVNAGNPLRLISRRA
jgi:acetyltransferase-like isoleucine patch superfamily enzyme